MILCVHCGRQNRRASQFCTFCGSRLAEEGLVVARLSLVGGVENREYLVSGAERSIGRDEANDIVILDQEMSARHARIVCREERFWVEDLDSRNGTFVNGTRIAESTLLHDADLLKMGSTLMEFRA